MDRKQWITGLVETALLIGILAVASTVRVKAEQPDRPPALPDYTKAPYRLVEAFPDAPAYLHDGKAPMNLFTDCRKQEEDEESCNIIGVFLNARGKPDYAEWVSVSEGPMVRGYQRTDGTWVFVQQKLMKDTDYP